MIFDNTPIDFSQLPVVEETPLLRPAPNYLKASMWSTAFFILILAAGAVAAILIPTETPFTSFNTTVLGSVGIITVFSFWYTWYSFHQQGYALRQHDIIYRRGVFIQSLTTIPFNRVQHCEISQGPIDRYFGIKTLEIYTAGGSSSDLRIPGLADTTTQQLKDFITQNTALDGYQEEE